MSDDFDVVRLDEDEVHEVLHWAVGTGALIVLLDGTYEEDGEDSFTEEELRDRIKSYRKAVALMWDAMPEVLVAPATAIAEESAADAEEEEAQVEQFRKELDEL